MQQALMETERKNMAEVDMNSPGLTAKERGKFASLNKKEAELVLETYIKRSFSNRDNTSVEKKVRVQRSVSDLSRFRRRMKENKKVPLLTKAEIPNTEKKDTVNVKNPTKSEEKVQQYQQPVSMVNTKPAKKSWFRNLLDHLLKKEENPPIQNESLVSSGTPENDGRLTKVSRKASIKKNGIQRALSFKKSVSEEETKPKRPTYLPLKRTNKPSSAKPQEKQEDRYYQQMSEEIELLVNDADSTRKQSLNEESAFGETKGIDDVIKQIVSILQKEGDAYDRKIREDPNLNNFIRNISYNSFKQLADVYIDKKMKKRGPDDTPEDMKFAFSIHFTKQVAGIATHPVNRIMGFGNQYLQDTFTWLSRSRDNLNAVIDQDGCMSPD